MRLLQKEEIVRRKNRLLQTVILEYINTAQPVSSTQVAQLDGMELSSATVRNLLHALERDGYLTHPHTSAGRIPTDKGYRYYVDYLINLQEILDAEHRRIETEYSKKLEEIENLLSYTSRSLAYFSHHAGFVVQPRMAASCFRRVELINIDPQHVLLVLVATNGFVRHKIIASKEPLPAASLRRLSRWMNTRFREKNLRELCLGFAHEANEHFSRENSNLEQMLELFTEPIEHMGRAVEERELLLEGESSLLTSADMRAGPGAIREVASALENREKLLQSLRREIDRHAENARERISVVIGRETRELPLKELALIAKAFETKEHTVGLLGILGPKRMDYAKMMSLVENIQHALQKALQDYE